jgi:membrane associated rhomboid family serine protease
VFGFFFQTELVGKVLPWLAGTASPGSMLLKPWTLISYMFVHVGLFHLLGNMLILYFAGRIFSDLLNAKRFTAVYFMGGIAGFLAYFAAFNLFPVFSGAQGLIYGASASVIAILVALATYMPNMEVRLILIGNVKLKWIAVFFVALDIAFLDSTNSGGHIAHLGGAAFGYLFSLSLKNGQDWSKYFWGVVNFFGELIKPKPKMKVAGQAPRTAQQGSNTATAPYRREKGSAEQEKIDAILDKISRSGYDSLTKAEKEFLFKASKK